MHAPSSPALAAPAVPPSPALAVLGALDAVLALVDRLFVELRPHLPAARLRRVLRDGCWVVGLTLGGGLEARTPYSRVDVRIQLLAGGTRLGLATRKTVRDRDLPSGAVETALDAAGWVAAEAFLEAELLGFAERWFTRD